MPAPAVIPALIVYIKVVAVKKLVVDHLVFSRLASVRRRECYLLENFVYLNWSAMLIGHFPEKKIRVFKAGQRLEYYSLE